MPLRDVLVALLAVTILGTNFVAIKVGLEALPPLMLTGLRFFFAAFPAILIVAPPKAPARLVVAFGLTLGVVQFGLLFVAIGMGMPAGLASLVIQMQVFFTVALAAALLGEVPGRLQVAAGTVAAGGIAVIAAHRMQSAPLLPLLLVIGAALAWGAANVIVKRMGRVDMLAVMVWGSAAAPLPLFVLSAIIEGPGLMAAGLGHATWRTAAAVGYLAYPTTLLAFGLWARLLGRHAAATVAPFALLVPVVGLASTALALGEPVDGAEIAGAALVLMGLALNVRGGVRRRVAPRQAAPANGSRSSA